MDKILESDINNLRAKRWSLPPKRRRLTAVVVQRRKMKKLLAVAIVFIAVSSRGEDMQKYLSDTQEMVRQGKNQEALERFVWFHDHALEHEPAGMYGVRLSFALSYWKALGDVYPPRQNRSRGNTRPQREDIDGQQGKRRTLP